MPKNSDIDSIIKMLRSDNNNSIDLRGGQNLDVPAEINGGSDDRTTMVIVLGIIAGLVLGALFYYCVMYMPAQTEAAPAMACESSLKKENTDKVVAVPPSNNVPAKNPPSSGLDAKDAPKRVDTKPPVGLSKNAPVKLAEEHQTQPLFSLSTDNQRSGLTLDAFKQSNISSTEFKMPSKPLQPSLDAAKEVAGANSSAAKLLNANKQLIDATENNRLRQKMMIATEGLTQYKPEVPVARRRGEQANEPLLAKMRNVNGNKIRKITKSKEGPGLFETPITIYEDHEPEKPHAAIGKQLSTDANVPGVTVSSVLSTSLPY